MNAIAPLLFALLLINHQKLRDNKQYRFSVFSIVGIVYFFLLKYASHYWLIFNLDQNTINYAQFTIIGITLLLCFSRWIVSAGIITSTVLMALFLISASSSFLFDREIKTVIADFGGYFEASQIISKKRIRSYNPKYFHFSHQVGGYTLKIPQHWTSKTTNSGLKYFEFVEGEVKVAEVRPKCFHGSNLTLAEISTNWHKQNLAENKQTYTECSQNATAHICFLKSIQDSSQSPIERWHWFWGSKHTPQKIELDALIFGDSPTAKRDIEFIFGSLVPHKLKTLTPTCQSPVEWF